MAKQIRSTQLENKNWLFAIGLHIHVVNRQPLARDSSYLAAVAQRGHIPEAAGQRDGAVGARVAGGARAGAVGCASAL